MGVLGILSFPIFTLFLEPLFFRERLRGTAVIAVFLVVAGLLLVAPDFDVRNTQTLGLLWAVFSGFVYAIFSLISRSAVRSLPPLTTSFYQQVFAGLTALPFAASGLGALTGLDVAWLAILGVIFTALAQWLINSGLRYQSVQTLSVLLALEPLYAILLAWLFIGEVPAARTLLGGAIICATVVWVSARGRRTSNG
jgi:drug/metabolite transporter (DMT)-like permease